MILESRQGDIREEIGRYQRGDREISERRQRDIREEIGRYQIAGRGKLIAYCFEISLKTL